MNWTEEQLAEHMRRIAPDATTGKRRINFEFDIAYADPNAPEPPKSEALIEAECTKLLEEDGWRALRTDPVSDRSKGKGFGELGMADHWYARPLPSAGPFAVEMLWCEFKTGRNKAEKHQRDWHTKERARGFVTWIANEDFPATVEGFREHYANSGLKRNKAVGVEVTEARG